MTSKEKATRRAALQAAVLRRQEVLSDRGMVIEDDSAIEDEYAACHELHDKLCFGCGACIWKAFGRQIP